MGIAFGGGSVSSKAVYGGTTIQYSSDAETVCGGVYTLLKTFEIDVDGEIKVQFDIKANPASASVGITKRRTPGLMNEQTTIFSAKSSLGFSVDGSDSALTGGIQNATYVTHWIKINVKKGDTIFVYGYNLYLKNLKVIYDDVTGEVM